MATREAARPQEVLFSVVVPCYNEEEGISDLLSDLIPKLEVAAHGAWEIILVDDGSLDRTYEVIRSAHEQNPRVRGLQLSRNFGHQSAIFAGLAYASGNYIGVMDADLQDPPAVLIQCFEKARHEELDLVYAVRKHRREKRFLKFGYWAFYRMMHAMAEYTWPVDTGDFSVFTRKVASLIMRLPEHVRVLRGLRSWVGLRQGFLEYERPSREKGESKYSFLGLCALAINALTSFSNVPLRLASLVGVSMSLISLILSGFFVVNRFFPRFTLFGYYVGANPGTTTVVILLLLIGSLLFLCIGILGEYLGIVMKEVKRRPIAIVQHQLGIKTSAPHYGLVLEADPLEDTKILE